MLKMLITFISINSDIIKIAFSFFIIFITFYSRVKKFNFFNFFNYFVSSVFK